MAESACPLLTKDPETEKPNLVGQADALIELVVMGGIEPPT